MHRFRDALNFKQMFMTLIWEREGGFACPQCENPLSFTLQR